MNFWISLNIQSVDTGHPDWGKGGDTEFLCWALSRKMRLRCAPASIFGGGGELNFFFSSLRLIRAGNRNSSTDSSLCRRVSLLQWQNKLFPESGCKMAMQLSFQGHRVPQTVTRKKEKVIYAFPFLLHIVANKKHHLTCPSPCLLFSFGFVYLLLSYGAEL